MNRTERTRIVLERLRKQIPEPETELQYGNPFELLVAVVLSAQCTDARVNKTTPALFEAYPTPEALARAEPEDVFPIVRSVSYPNNKSKHLVGLARRMVEVYDGKVPESIKELQTLPGVGRKTALVVASVAFGQDALPVDTHVYRVAHRLFLVPDSAATPLKVERSLRRVMPREAWSEGHHLLILHGRYTCVARKPKCERCPLSDVCRHYARLQRLPAPLDGLTTREGRYFCKTEGRYFDEPDAKIDRYGTEQVCCPHCQSMTVYDARTGQTTKQVPDFRA